MVMNIKDREVHDLARELAERTGTSMTTAVKTALKDALARTGRGGDEVRERLDAISRHCADLPLRDTRTADEILGNDERGLPR